VGRKDCSPKREKLGEKSKLDRYTLLTRGDGGKKIKDKKGGVIVIKPHEKGGRKSPEKVILHKKRRKEKNNRQAHVNGK